jgi:glutathione S-transferase
MKLYTMPNTCALSVQIAIRWAGLDIEVEVMPSGGSRMPGYLAINPHGKVPALILEDGSVLTEAAAILPYLAELAPGTKLGGGDIIERARVAQALGFMVGEVHSDWTPHFAPHLFLSAPVAGGELEAMTFERLAPQYAFLDETLGRDQWMLFGRRTVADAYLYMLARTADLMPGGLTPYPMLTAFRARLDRDPAVVAALAEQDSIPGAAPAELAGGAAQ